MLAILRSFITVQGLCGSGSDLCGQIQINNSDLDPVNDFVHKMANKKLKKIIKLRCIPVLKTYFSFEDFIFLRVNFKVFDDFEKEKNLFFENRKNPKSNKQNVAPGSDLKLVKIGSITLVTI